MIVLGLSGGFDLLQTDILALNRFAHHDSACALVMNGTVMAAIEEERLNRLKHTNKFPSKAIRACLEQSGLALADVDTVAYNFTQQAVERRIQELSTPLERRCWDAFGLMQYLFARELGWALPRNKLRFVDHHTAHAVSAFALSGFDASLVITLDGYGDGLSGAVFTGTADTTLQRLAAIPESQSLGIYYLRVIAYLGYTLFDEYKVMGLAPYGDPNVYRTLFAAFYSLLPSGRYTLHMDKISSLLTLGPPRRKGEPFTQVHKDIAAALQASLEDIAFHILRECVANTGQTRLCLAGGVVHNCSLTGKLLRSGLFEQIFVQPASHDAGGALGAALDTTWNAVSHRRSVKPLDHVYWGSDIGNATQIEKTLARWQSLLHFSPAPDIASATAELLAAGNVVGWVQGRSEFGPRALGNRSILADPRPESNKDRINAMVKKRESYRPFAPAVLAEEAGGYFEIPTGVEPYCFMTATALVREDKRSLLGATTHVDGTARIQVVTREANSRFWELLHAFKARTGVPVLLNTSFNNNAEPIVDSVEDAVVCFLTTNLDALIVGDFIVRKKALAWDDYLSLKPVLPPYVELRDRVRPASDGSIQHDLSLTSRVDEDFSVEVSERVYAILCAANGKRRLGDLCRELLDADKQAYSTIVDQCLDLWARRLLTLEPSEPLH